MEQFEEAKNKLSHLKKDPGNEVKLKIYALFKQVGGGPGVLLAAQDVGWLLQMGHTGAPLS